MHDPNLILTLSAALVAALVFGLASKRIGLSPLVGYLLAGVAIGPYTPGFVADVHVAAQLAEVGVILLMFGVGLHFHLEDLLAVRRVAVPGAVGQSLVATGLGALLAWGAGWSLGAGLVLGVGLSVASTVVLLRVLMDFGRLETVQGHIAVGWLVVEDIFTVVVLVLLPALAVAFASGAGMGGAIVVAIGLALLKIALLAVVMLVGGARLIPWLLAHVARLRSGELFTLTVLVLALAIAAASALWFGVSMALGAFLAGMVVGRSRVSHQAAADALPLRDAFAVLFFVSVGMLFDPSFLVAEPLLILGTLAIVLVGKPVAAFAIVLVLGLSVRTALTVAIALAQIGEFSFILGDLGRSLDVFPPDGQTLLVAAAMLSIALNPLFFRLVEPAEAWLRRRKRLWAVLQARSEARAQALSDRTAGELEADDSVSAVVVGYGPVGKTVARILRDFGIRPVIVDLNVDTITRLEGLGHPAIYGDAGRAEVLRAAGIERAKFLLVTLPDLPRRIPVVITARDINPGLSIFVRARYLGEREMLEEVGATAVCYEEAEAAVALGKLLLRAVGAEEVRIAEEAKKIREEFAIRHAEPFG